MIAYRPQRGSLSDAMQEAQVFADESAMKAYVAQEWNKVITIDDIIIGSEPLTDTRIGWRDTRYVCAKRMKDMITMKTVEFEIPQCIGYCATDFDPF